MKEKADTASGRAPSEQADVCVIGAGPAGALVSYVLAKQGHDVVILEAGKRFDKSSRLERMERSLRPAFHRFSVWDMQDPLNEYRSVGTQNYPVNWHRVKAVGGSTLHWGASVVRLPETAFEMETEWGIGVDWPIAYADLRPFYAKAEDEIGVAGVQDDPFSPPRENPYPMDAFPRAYSDSLYEAAANEVGIELHTSATARNTERYDGRSQCVGYGTCNPVCPSGAKYSADVHIEKAEENGARVIDQAVVQQLEHGPDGDRITGAVYRTRAGDKYTQNAQEFVLAAGGIENPRLLLLSDSEQHPDGLANSSGAVGKYLMDHIYAIVTGEVNDQTKQKQGTPVGMKCHQFVEPDSPPPGSFKLEFGNNAGPSVSQLALAQRDPLGNLQQLAGSPYDITSWTTVQDTTKPIEWGDELLETIDEQYGNYFSIRASIEVLPHAENRVTLSNDVTDPFGNPVPEVSWGYMTEYEQKTKQRAFEVIEQIVDHLEPEVYWTKRIELLRGVAHSSGTTRMGTDPDTSVVNSNLRAHDVENLHIAGASTFPTASSQQPTLTIAALSLRLGEHLHNTVL